MSKIGKQFQFPHKIQQIRYRKLWHFFIGIKPVRNFCSIAKSGKLSNLFLQSFVKLVQEKEIQNSNPNKILPQSEVNKTLRSLDVLIAMMDQVKLKKEN